MNRSCTNVLPITIAMCLGLAVTGTRMAHAATPDPQEIDDDLRAKIQKEKNKTRSLGNRFGSYDAMKNNGACDINIGNEPEQKGAHSIAQRDRTVIVEGPVINTGKCGR